MCVALRDGAEVLRVAAVLSITYQTCPIGGAPFAGWMAAPPGAAQASAQSIAQAARSDAR